MYRLTLPALVMASLPLLATPARADFRLCNNTSSRVGVAIGYRDKQGWLTEGWWNVSARSCESILKGPLAARYYYVYSVDYDQGGEWSGQSFMCTRDKEFTIRGFENCLARGYDRSGFFEIDTGQQKSWTVQLSEQAQNGARPKSDAPRAAVPPAAPAAPTPTTPGSSAPAPAVTSPNAPAAATSPAQSASPTAPSAPASAVPALPTPKPAIPPTK